MTNEKSLPDRLRDHARLHWDLAMHSDEQQQWARDLIEAANLLEKKPDEPSARLEQYGICPECKAGTHYDGRRAHLEGCPALHVKQGGLSLNRRGDV